MSKQAVYFELLMYTYMSVMKEQSFNSYSSTKLQGLQLICLLVVQKQKSDALYEFCHILHMLIQNSIYQNNQ